MCPVIRAESDPATRRTIQETITAQLPEWFGRADSNLHYASQAEFLPGWVASIQDRDVGLLLLKRHGTLSAEIYWIGIEPGHHRHGVGRALLNECAPCWLAKAANSCLPARCIPIIRTSTTAGRADFMKVSGSS